MKGYQALAGVALFVILAHTRVTLMPGWTVPAIPLALVTVAIAACALLAVLLHQLRAGRRPPARRYVPAPGGPQWTR